MIAVVAVTAFSGVAAAAAHAPVIRTGYYADLVGVSSAQVTFHVRAHRKVPDLVFGCEPLTPSPTSGTVSIAVRVPAFTLSASGRFSYSGPAEESEDFARAPKTGTTTVTISGYHVNGPVHHYVFEGRHLQQTTAFKGTVSSPACKSPGTVRFTLFGPIAGE